MAANPYEGDLRYILGRSLFGGQAREEAAQAAEQAKLVALLKQLQPTTETQTTQGLAPGVFPGAAKATWGNEALFPQGGPVGSPPVPSRATFGNEALMPQGGPGPGPMAGPVAPPYAPIRPDQEWRDIYSPEWAAGATGAPAEPERVGGATGFAERRPQPEPESLAAAFEAESPETLGGATSRAPQPETRTTQRTVTTPGKDLMDLVMQDPKTMSAFLKAFPDAPKWIQAQREQQMWAGPGGPGGGAAPAAPGVAPGGEAPPAAPGTPEEVQLAKATARRESLEPQIAKMEADRSGVLENSAPGQRYRAAYDKAVDNERQALAAVREAKKTKEPKEPTEFGTVYAEAKDTLREELGREPTDKEIGAKVRELKTKAKEPEKPLVIEGVAYDVAIDPATGERRLQSLPGQQAKAAKPWWDGKSETELASVVNDPTAPQAMRDQATQTLKDLQTRKVEQQKAGVPTPPERTAGAQHLNVIRLTRSIRQAIDDPAVQAKIGGPWGLNTQASVILNKFKDDPKFSTLMKADARIRALVTHELTGAAVGSNDTDVYLAGIPSIKSMTLGEYRAALDVIEEDAVALIEYGNQIRQSGEINLPVDARSIPLPTPSWKQRGSGGAQPAPRSAPLTPDKRSLLDEHKGP